MVTPTISTHVLDTEIGQPAAGVPVRVVRRARRRGGRARRRGRSPTRTAGSLSLLDEGARGRRLSHHVRGPPVPRPLLLPRGQLRDHHRGHLAAPTMCRCSWRRSGSARTGAAEVTERVQGGAVTTGSAFEPDELSASAFGELIAPLFERAPRFIARLAARSAVRLVGRAVRAVRAPRAGHAARRAARAHRRAPAHRGTAWFGVGPLVRRAGLRPPKRHRPRRSGSGRGSRPPSNALNDAYEARFGFRFVIFVAGRPRAAIVPLLEAARAPMPSVNESGPSATSWPSRATAPSGSGYRWRCGHGVRSVGVDTGGAE